MKITLNQSELIPPYCPNTACYFHNGGEAFFVRNGTTSTRKPPFVNQRFKCRSCQVQFSSNTFALDFRKRLAHLSENILHYSMNGMSNNSIARLLKVAEGTVRDRLKVMSQQSLLFEKQHQPTVLIEDIAYDGFETFTFSQYSPCYINTAVGRRSLFIYHNTFSPLNRKGRMTPEQKSRNSELIQKHGLYPQNSVFLESCYIMNELSQKGAGRTIFTDEHKSYARAHRSFESNLEHKTISSRARRDSGNPLFPINHLHMCYRHFFSSQHRETISFQKNEAALLEKVQLMKIYRNFMNPKFVKKNKFDPDAHKKSPAMYLGLADQILDFSKIYGIRKTAAQVKLDEREKAFLDRCYQYSRQKIVA